jgi:hypothetical protein
MSNPLDANIPVLTDIILPQEPAAAALVPEVAPASAPIPAPDIAPVQAAPAEHEDGHAAALSEEEWSRLELTIRENVLKQVLARVDFVLEHRVRDSLADVLQTAVEQLATDIRAGLHKTMEEVITRAITQEISKSRMSK